MARKQTWNYETWLRDPKDQDKDKKLDSGSVEATSEDIAKAIAIRKLDASHDDAVANGHVVVNVRPF